MKKLTLKKQDDKYIFTLEIPQTEKRYNPYDEQEHGEMNSIAGLIDKKMSEYGFVWLIDMDYKDKGDQWTGIFLECSSFMSEGEFIELCKKNEIDYMYDEYEPN